MPSDAIHALTTRWRDDKAGTYRTWFLWEERLKNFRSIRRGLAQVVAEIKEGTFGNKYKGSSLETVVGSIVETIRQLDAGGLQRPGGFPGQAGEVGRIPGHEAGDPLSQRRAPRPAVERSRRHRRLLFDVGSGRYAAPPTGDDAAARAAWEADLARVREEDRKARKAREAEPGAAFPTDVWTACRRPSSAPPGWTPYA